MEDHLQHRIDLATCKRAIEQIALRYGGWRLCHWRGGGGGGAAGLHSSSYLYSILLRAPPNVLDQSSASFSTHQAPNLVSSGVAG